MHAGRRIDDATAEAVLAGRAAAPELATLAGMVAACRRLADRPVRPRGELAVRLAAGRFGEEGPPRTALASMDGCGGGRNRRSAAGTGRGGPMHVRLALAAGGLAVAATGLGSAGFAGVLPDAAQDRFESVVESVTPYTFPRQADGADRGTGNGDPGAPDDPGNAEDAGDGADFGEQVREDARDGGVDGDEIRERVRERGEQRGDPPRPTVPPIEAPPVPPTEAAPVPAPPAGPPAPDRGVAPGAPPRAGQPPPSSPAG